MKDFTVHIPTKIFFGENNGEAFFNAIKSKYKNILLVTGSGSVNKLGYKDSVVNSLKENNITVHEFDGIEPNPLAKTINKAGESFKGKNIEAVIALGGGSAMDAAKGIAALIYIADNIDSKTTTLSLDIWDYVLGEKLSGQIPNSLPVIAIPTTAATASEVTPYSVISNTDTGGKAPLAYEFFKPELSWINPFFTKLLPPTVTQDGANDILSHVFENYILGGNASTLTDRYCENIIKTVIETLPVLLASPTDLNLRGDLLWCSTLALNGMQSAGREPSIFPLHAIEHAMSAVKHELAHGRGLSTLFPAYFRWLWNNGRAKDRLQRLGTEIFNLPSNSELTGLHFIDQFEKWLKSVNSLQSAYSLGFTDSDFEHIAKYVVKTYGGGQALPVLGDMTEKDIVEILKLTESQG